jgi:hypothetical protein
MDPQHWKKCNLFSSFNFFFFFKFLVIKTLDPELDPDPAPQLEKCWIRIRIKSMRIRNPAILI